MGAYITDLKVIAAQATDREEENDHFLRFIQRRNGAAIDVLVHDINDSVSAGIDCTQCGNCCKSLVINITAAEIEGLAAYLGADVATVKHDYIEESMGGQYFINTMPCHFLSDNKCRIYEQRFTECRAFPHLHKPGFKERFLGTLLHYGTCPIVYNVIEQLKDKTGFRE
ncbi:MAG: hypothetical protein BGO69_02980 [Bacteroidetes bacterium 46-16]|nr:MAG: hypothetical protein BGO69_02980 [Bacteroidetes bacterium 46-16]